jgi:hypothetical protein
MQPAGHGAIPVNKATPVFPKQRAGSLVIVGHKDIPLFFGTDIKDIRGRKLRPDGPEFRASFFRLLKNRESYHGRQYVKSLFQENGIKQGDIEKASAAGRTTLPTDDTFPGKTHGPPEPLIHGRKKVSIQAEHAVKGWFHDDTLGIGRKSDTAVFMVAGLYA